MLRPSRPMMRPFISSFGSVNDGHRGLGHMVGGALLDGQCDDVAGLLFALVLGLGLDIAHHGGGVVIGFLLHAADDHLLGLILGHAGDAFQLLHLLVAQLLGLVVEGLRLLWTFG